jgi:hypothetical protein
MISALLLACAQCANGESQTALRQLSIVLLVFTPFVIAGWVAFRLTQMRQ